MLKAKFATLDGAMTETTMERSATLRQAQRSLCEAFGKTEGVVEAGVVLDGRAFTQGDDTPFAFAPDGATITVILKRPKPTIVLRRGF